MANKQRGFIAVELDKPRNIRFSLNALAELEEALGVPFDQLEQAMSKGGIRVVRKLLWIGLKHEDAALTEEQVGDMIDTSNINELTASLNAAFGAAAGEPGNGKAGAGGPGNRRRN